jgi:hypothetical protein
MPEATFFVFLFHSPRFYLFTMIVIGPLPLEAIKGEAGATSREIVKHGKTHGNNS